MKEVIFYVCNFLVAFIIAFILYYFLFIHKSRRNYKVPSEAKYLINLYELDINKFSYRKFLLLIGLVSSIDISLVAIIVSVVDGVVWQLLFGFIAVVPVAIISFMLLGRYYKQKQEKDNKEELAKEKKYLDKKDEKKKKKQEKKVQRGRKKNDK